MIKVLQKHRRQKYENPPITTTEGLTHLGRVDTIYHSIHDELNYNPVATSNVVRFLDMLLKCQSQTKTESQALQKLSKTSQRTTTSRICKSSQNSEEKTQAQDKEDKQALHRVQKANGTGAL